MTIKRILDEIANESSTLKKTEIVTKYKDNELFKRVLYLANSKRVKFYIKQIPEYDKTKGKSDNLLIGLEQLLVLSNRELTGANAIHHLKQILEFLTPDNAYVIERVIEKDCKINFGTRMINKVFPDLIERTGYMGCKPYSKDLVLKLLAKGSVYSQEKMDGRYMNSIIQGGEILNESRQGEPTILENPYFFTELSQLKDCVLNGELTMNGVNRYESNGIISSLITIATKKSEGKDASKDIAKLEKKHMPYQQALDLVRFTAWDILTIDEYFTRKCKRPYSERLEDLNETLKDCKMLSVVETREVSTIEEVMQHFNEILEQGGEGTVVKSKDGVWADSKPAYQIKVKKEMNLDLRIIGFNYGTKGTKNENVISSLVCQSEDGLLVTSPGGMDEDTMDYVTENMDKLFGTIEEMKCSGLSKDNEGNYSTLHPRHSKFRDDKNIANTLAECIEIDKSCSLL
jgi:DNA ligase-1